METEGTTIEETTIPQPEATPEEATTEEEGVDSTLPSDVETFVVPDKFKGKTAEEVAKAYVELEKMGQGTQPNQATDTPPAAEEGEPKVDYAEEYRLNGSLSEESYKELEADGYTRADVDDKIEYETYKYQKRVDDITADIGGAEVYKEVSQWLEETMPEEELNTLSTEMNNTSLSIRKLIVKALYNDYRQANGDTSGDVVHTNENQYAASKGYRGQVELDEDMNDKRYGEDRAYTKAVEEKLGRTKGMDRWK